MLQTLIKIVKEANKIIMDIYQDFDPSKVQYKSDYQGYVSPLTEADTKASNYICQELKKYRPNIPIICEENKEVPYKERKDWDIFWLVDPLDGTKEFINKNGEFTVNIGLIYKGEPIAGVVSIPCKNTIYYAASGYGAYKEDIKTGKITKLKCQTFSTGENIIIMVSRSHLNTETQEYCAKYNVKKYIPAGSSLKILYLAENIAQLYPRLAPTYEWDIAAADAILREAGGHLIMYDSDNAEDNQLMTYNKESIVNKNFVASCPYHRI